MDSASIQITGDIISEQNGTKLFAYRSLETLAGASESQEGSGVNVSLVNLIDKVGYYTL